MATNTKIIDDQGGFAAIVVAVVLVLVLSLITIGFAELMTHEQRSSLDKQLSSQAYYAAESGVNDAAKAISAGFDQVKDDCGPLTDTSQPGSQYLTSNDVGADSSTNVKYSCLLINPTPKSLEYSSIGTEQSKVVEISSAAGASTPIRTIVIGWQDSDTGNTFRSGGEAFPPVGQWGATTGALRVSLTPDNELDMNGLADNTFTAFLYPDKDPNSGDPVTMVSYDSGRGTNGGIIAKAKCNKNNKPRYCAVAITGLAWHTYFLNMRSIYRDSRVTIRAYTDPASVISIANQLSIKNAQTLVDSTGKAQDVLKRIQVRIPVRNGYDHPDFGIESAGNICKQLKIWPGSHTPTSCSP